MPRRPRMKRLLLLLLAYTVGGAIINVAVAWGLALTVVIVPSAPSLCGEFTPIDTAGAATMYFHGAGTDVVTAMWYYDEGSPIRLGTAEGDRRRAYKPMRLQPQAFIDTSSLSELPRWSRGRMASWLKSLNFADYLKDGYHSEWVTWQARGWPLRSLFAGQTVDRKTNTWDFVSEFEAIALKDQPFLDPLALTDQQSLPCRIWWPGFAINTIFYAAILWLLFAAPGCVRRRFVIRGRARRGQCPACAYPVGASTVCTECGRPVTPRA